MTPSERKKVINRAIEKGLDDIKAGRTSGPFQSIHEFKRALRASIKK
jgi:hypothetical protein